MSSTSEATNQSEYGKNLMERFDMHIQKLSNLRNELLASERINNDVRFDEEMLESSKEFETIKSFYNEVKSFETNFPVSSLRAEESPVVAAVALKNAVFKFDNEVVNLLPQLDFYSKHLGQELEPTLAAVRLVLTHDPRYTGGAEMILTLDPKYANAIDNDLARLNKEFARALAYTLGKLATTGRNLDTLTIDEVYPMIDAARNKKVPEEEIAKYESVGKDKIAKVFGVSPNVEDMH